MSLMFDPDSSLIKEIKDVKDQLLEIERKVSLILENVALKYSLNKSTLTTAISKLLSAFKKARLEATVIENALESDDSVGVDDFENLEIKIELPDFMEETDWIDESPNTTFDDSYKSIKEKQEVHFTDDHEKYKNSSSSSVTRSHRTRASMKSIATKIQIKQHQSESENSDQSPETDDEDCSDLDYNPNFDYTESHTGQRNSESKQLKIRKREPICIIKKRMPVRCPVCNKVSPTYQAHESHVGKTCLLFQTKVSPFKKIKSDPEAQVTSTIEIVSKTNKKSIMPVRCFQCGKVSPNQLAMTRHLKHTCVNRNQDIIHNKSASGFHKSNIPKGPPWVCQICEKDYKAALYLRRHMETHNEGKHYKCKICNKRFSVKRYMQDHQKIHNENVKHLCDICPASFKSKHSLTRHIYLVHNRTNRLCYICGKGFYLLSHVTRHIRKVHENQRPYVCTVCSRGFKEKSHLITHMKIHEDGRILKTPRKNQRLESESL